MWACRGSRGAFRMSEGGCRAGLPDLPLHRLRTILACVSPHCRSFPSLQVLELSQCRRLQVCTRGG